jgi:hypothetical protein
VSGRIFADLAKCFGENRIFKDSQLRRHSSGSESSPGFRDAYARGGRRRRFRSTRGTASSARAVRGKP